MRKVWALAFADLRVSARRGEALVLNLIVPVIVLVALSQSGSGVERAIPFAYVQAVLATSMVSLGITTGFDRRFRVLVRLGTTPLGRRGLVTSKIVSVIISQLFQLFVLSIVGLILGWEPTPLWLLALPLCWIASAAFAGIALMVAGRVRAEANLGLQNLLYLIMMGVAGIGFAGTNAPDSLRIFSYFVPSGSLHSLLRWANGIGEFSILALVILVAQGIIFPILASRKFSFDES
jgi:ABC-2 type transport system permease protein